MTEILTPSGKLTLEQSRIRSKNVICNLCGKYLKPIKNDRDRRYCHLICEKRYDNKIFNK